MRKNTKAKSDPILTHEGGSAIQINAEKMLRRSVMSCLLWENEFYEDGIEIATRIENLASKISPEILAAIAIEARHEMHLRHVPLLLLKTLIKTGSGPIVAQTIERVVSRADELSELVAIYWDGKNKKMLPAQMKKGLGAAFRKFDEYNLAKYNRDSKVKLRDVLFLTHAKPKDEEQAALWKRLVDGTMAIPDTWETELSAGKDKKATFERLIREGKLGYFALLRNLRNMMNAGVDRDLVKETIIKSKNGADKILPFRYIAAARAAPQLEPAIDIALNYRIGQLPILKGSTIILVDVSGSMFSPLSGKSDLTRADAAAALSSIVNAEDLQVFSFSNDVVRVPPRRGMAGVDAVINSQHHSSTYLGKAVEHVNKIGYDRLIVITDEQSHDRVGDPVGKNAYMINVASTRNGVGYGKWKHIDGFSENVIRWIIETEK